METLCVLTWTQYTHVWLHPKLGFQILFKDNENVIPADNSNQNIGPIKDDEHIDKPKVCVWRIFGMCVKKTQHTHVHLHHRLCFWLCFTYFFQGVRECDTSW
jgi:hypothetical protein